MTFQAKIYSSLGSLLLLGAAVGGAGFWFQQKLASELGEAVELSAPKLDLVQAIRARSWEMVANMRKAYISLANHDQAGADTASRGWAAARSRMNEQFAQIRPLMAGDDGLALLNRMESALRTFDPVARDYIQYCRDGQFQRATALAQRIGEFSDQMDRTGLELRSQQRARLKETLARVVRLRSLSLCLNILMGIAVLLVGTAAAAAVRRATATLTQAVRELTDTSIQVGAASSEISSAATTLAQAASEQAASLQETSASTHEIELMTSNNAKAASNASSHSQQNVHIVQQTNESFRETQSSMDDIVTSSGKISQIIRVIDEIAFQTNILALNAAVEAARAGQSGMGFAVVATEVRRLAQRAAQAAGETTQLVEESISHSNRGKARLDGMETAIAALTTEAAEFKKLAEDVNVSSEQQLRGVREISKAMEQMELVTQQVAASAEEGAAAGTELNSQVVQLNHVVGTLSHLLGSTAAK